MSLNTMQETSAIKEKVVVSSQEITSKKWKFNSFFKALVGIIYGFFFGLLPGSFNFGRPQSVAEPDSYEISAVISLLFMGVLSISLIFWLFKGDVKKKHPLSYSMMHLINALLLSVGMLVAIILAPNYNDQSRYFILATSYACWAIVMILLSLFIMGNYRKQFPLSWAKKWYVVFSFLFMGLIHFIIYFSKIILLNQFNLNDAAFIIQFGWLIALVIAICFFGFGIAFIKRYRDVLLGERTDNEIDSIHEWNNARILGIIAGSIIVCTYGVSLIWNDAIANMLAKWLSTPLYIELALDLFFLIPYIILVSVVKIKSSKNAKSMILNSKVFKAIDNGLLLDFLAWAIIVKSVLIQGSIINEQNNIFGQSNDDLKSIMLLFTFGSLMIIYGFSIIVQINIPNLKNTAISIVTIFFVIALAIFSIFFAVYLQASDIMSKYIYVLLPFIILLGSSISLIIKISMIAKIFRSKAVQNSETINKSHLFQEAQNDVNSFIDNEALLNSKTETIEASFITDNAEVNEI